MRTRKAFAAVVLAAILVWTAGSVGYAQWNGQASGGGGVITAGNLELSESELTWRTEAPCDVPSSGSGWATLSQYVAMPGDVIELDQRVIPDLTGENLAARLTVSWPGQAPADVTATYRVLANGTQIAPASGSAPIGSPVAIAGQPSGEWSVRVRLEFGGEYTYTNPDEPGSQDRPRIPGLVIALSQVREGEGFDS